MNMFCPLVREKCKGSECVMWKDGKCLVITFIENFGQLPEGEFEGHIPIPTGYEHEEISQRGIPGEIKSATPEELAAELVSFAKKEFPDEERMWLRNIATLFWESKKIERWSLPPDIKLKIEKAEILAQRQLESERETKERERLEKEKAELPSLVDSCVDWAKEHNLKRVTKADIEAFLLEKDIEVLPQTQRALYALVNVRLRSRH
jgi:hypothetical protein